MLEYGWGNPAPILLSGEDDPRVTDQANQMLEPFNQNLLPPVAAFPFPHHHHHHQQFQHQQQNQTFLDTRPKVSLNPSSAHADFSQHAPFPSNSTRSDFQAQIGLNLGVRTYFSSTNENFASRLYRGPRPANPPRCQADGCTSDFTSAKQYHKKHKVCDFHSKAPTVIKNGLTQRFCQQCSRFHLLPEFDQGKRSCRRRLADHNRRRRKSQSQDQYQLEKHRVSLLPDENTSYRSSSESGTPSSSSVSIAVSPPRIALDCLHFTQGSLLGSSSNSSLSWGKENLQLFQRQTTDKEG